mgnify:CR=1 FL=1
MSFEQKAVHNGGLAEDILPESQLRCTEFVFEAFNKKWDGRTDVQVSLLKAAVFPNPKDATTDRYKPFIVQTKPLRNLRETDFGAYDADDITFTDVAGIDMVVGILIHSGENPIAHIGHAMGLPLWTNGGDVTVTWDNGRNRIFRT